MHPWFKGANAACGSCIVHDEQVSLSHRSTRIYDELSEQLNYRERSFSKSNFHLTVENLFCFIKHFKYLWIHENHIISYINHCGWRRECESDLRSNDHYLSSNENKPWKKIQACMGFESMTSAIPVQCSTSWTNKPTGSWSLCWFWKTREAIKRTLLSVH